MNDEAKTILERGVEEVIVKTHLETALKSDRKLRVKFGIDPTSPDLHLGHAVVLRKLRQFQDAGHKIILIIGDFTAQIGDPSGRSETRKPLSEKEIKENLKNYLAQAGKIIDIKKAEIRHNSEWFKKNGLAVILELVKSASIQQTLEREDFQKRLKENKEISLLETLYPLLQGYDSVEIKSDLELGGTDQKFNLLMGRRVQRHFNMAEQDILTVLLLEGTDGARKMSKSYGNYIGLTEKPNEMFGKIMSVPDKLIEKYFALLTDIDQPKHLEAREAKLLLAETIVKNLHNETAAKKAKEEFIRIFSKKELPENLEALKIPNYKLLITELLITAGIESKSEARRLIEQNAVEINGAVKNNPQEILTLHKGDTLKIGKKRFLKIA